MARTILNLKTMNELMIGQVGRVAGVVVKCVAQEDCCDKCVFDGHGVCPGPSCGKWSRDDRKFVKFINPTPEEVSEFEGAEKCAYIE